MIAIFCMVQMPFFPILSYKYCHDITSDRFSHPSTNGHNDVIHDGFSMDVAAKPVKIYLWVVNTPKTYGPVVP